MRLRAILAGVMMLAVVLSPAALAQDGDGYHIVITYSDKEYDIGDQVDVAVHVFDKAQYASVDNVSLMIGSFSSLRDVELTETGTGKWTGTFNIEEGDITDFGFYKFVSMVAAADVGGEVVEEGYGTVLIPGTDATSGSLVVVSSLDPPSVYMRGGETKTITWKVYYQDQLTDPTSITGWLYVDSDVDTFDPVKESQGVYTYEYTMPVSPRSVEVDIEFDAELNVMGETLEGSNDVELAMNHFHVWAKKGAISDTTATFDLYVSNATGAAVQPASIMLDYHYEDDTFDLVSKSANGTTDADGRATINLPYNELGDQATEVEIEGKVTGQGKEQSIHFNLQVRDEVEEAVEPEPLGFDVIPDKDQVDFDKDVNLPSTAYYDGDPHASGTVYWYAYTMNAVLNKGQETTKVDGTFSVDFRTPAKGTMDPSYLMVHYESEIQDGATYFHEDTEDLYITSVGGIEGLDNPYDVLKTFKDGAVKISVDKLTKGKRIPVSVTYSKADERWLCAVILGNDPNPSEMGMVPTWTYWSTSFMDGAYGDICSYSGNGKFESTVFIPENLPSKDFYVAGLMMDQSALEVIMSGGNFADFIKTNYIPGLEIGQSGTAGGEDSGIVDRLMDPFIFGIPLLYWIFILLIVVVLGIVAGTLSTRKREPRDMDEVGLEPAEGPAFDGGPGPAAMLMPGPPPGYDQMQAMPGEADYGAPPPPPPDYYQQPQAQYAEPYQPQYGAPLEAPETAPPPAYETAAPPEPQYAPPPPAPQYAPPPPEPQYAPPPPEPQYAPPPPEPQYAPPPPEPQYAPPPPEPQYAPPPPEPQYAPPPPEPQYAPPPPEPQYAPPPPEPQYAPPAPAAPPAQAPAAPPPPPPAPAAPPAPAPAAPAAAATGTMTIRCQKCQTTLTIPRKRPIKVTCPNCGASGVLR